MRKHDAWGKPLLKVGDVVWDNLGHDGGTVVKILQVNANGPYLVSVKWFTWNNSATTQECVSELQLRSEA